MVKELLVKESIIAGEKLLSKLQREELSSTAAFWFYSENENKWNLVIATVYYNKYGPLKTLSKIYEIINNDLELKQVIDLSDIRIESPENPVIANLKHKVEGLGFPLLATITIPGFSEELIEDVYIYKL